jgi:hypothetical protein
VNVKARSACRGRSLSRKISYKMIVANKANFNAEEVAIAA